MININDYTSESLQDLVNKMESSIAELQAGNERLKEAQRWRVVENALIVRIAELEKAYRWISTTENPPPEDKRFVLAVNATNGKTYYFVLPDLNDSSDNAG